METRFSDKELEDLIQTWISIDDGQKYADDMTVIIDSVKNGIARLEIEETVFRIHIDTLTGIRKNFYHFFIFLSNCVATFIFLIIH